ncbi:MAG: DUF2797 domain-containing protein [Methanobacteriota archaeon]|nr:MAG: DUF2797 domain-containing protein [Euryarchaeota archaeon]
MFERADRLWLAQIERSLPFHAIGFEWRGFDPVLHCVNRSDDSPLHLDLKSVDYVISGHRECVGCFQDQQHTPCPRSAGVSRFTQCPDCAEESFIPYQECVFEPKCDGELCDVDFCGREHVLYLAFYNARVKIGMSSARRLEERLIEQGADAYAQIGVYRTRKRAREAEKEISARLRIPQSFRQRVLLEDLARRMDQKTVENKFARLCSSLETHFNLKPEELRRLDSYPIELPLDMKPSLMNTPGRHRGELVGVKGRWLIYRSGGMNALSLADVPSRFVGIGRVQ